MTNNLPEFVTSQEVAELLRVPLTSVRAWIRAGELKAFRVGRYNRILRSELNRFIENRQKQN